MIFNVRPKTEKLIKTISLLLIAVVSIDLFILRPTINHINQGNSVGASYKNHATLNIQNLNIQHQSLKQINNDASIAKRGGFINQVGASAVYDFQHDKNCQIAPSIVIAQAIVESNWGQSSLYTKYHNAFGIKASQGHPFATFGTEEVYNGQKEHIIARFRAFKNNSQGIDVHNQMLLNRFIGKNRDMNYKQDAYLLHDNGYATDPTYAPKLISIIQMYHLYRYDKMAEK